MTTNSENKTAATHKQPIVDQITPYKLYTAIIIREYCTYNNSDESKDDNDIVPRAKSRRDFCILTLKLLQSPDLDLVDFHRKFLRNDRFKIQQGVLDSFNKVLRDVATQGSGTLLDVVDSFEKIMSPSLDTSMSSSMSQDFPANRCFVSKNSVIGYFLRRLIVRLHRLTFSEVTTIFLRLKRDHDDWQVIDRCPSDSGLVPMTCSGTERNNQWSRKQAELFIATQAALITNNEEKALGPVELHERIVHLLQSNPSLSEAHFLSYLNHMRVKEFCGAVDSLHHCFDRRTTSPSGNTANAKTNDERPAKHAGNTSKVYRLAALNLAILHYQFGHREESLTCLKETIRISQASNDHTCLQHALSWLYRITTHNRERLIVHSVTKSFDLNMPYITSLGIQTYAKYACAKSTSPVRIFETLTKSDILNGQHFDFRDLVANGYAIKSALWSFYGKSEMASLWSQLLFYCSMVTDETSDSLGEGFCIALCNVAISLMQEGKYNAAEAVVQFAREKLSNAPHNSIWMLSENVVEYTRALHRENWGEALAACQKILTVDKYEGYLRMCELYLSKSDHCEAARYCDIVVKRYEGSEDRVLDITYYIRARVLQALIQFHSASTTNFSSVSLAILNDCLTSCEQLNLDYTAATITLHVANVQLALGSSGQALRLLERCLATVLAHGGSYDRARAVFLYVKCAVACGKHSGDSGVLRRACEMLERVKSDFGRVEAWARVRDVLLFQALLFNALGERGERNRCGAEFRELEDLHRGSKNCDGLLRVL